MTIAKGATSIVNGKLKVGRPKGVLSPETILKNKAEKILRTRIYKMTDKLISAQSIVAIGTHKMIRISIDADGKKHVETVRDEKRMQNLLDTGVYGKDYIIVEGSLPDYRAADALLNRGYGKPKESLDLTGEVSFSLIGLIAKRKELAKESESKKVDEPLLLE